MNLLHFASVWFIWMTPAVLVAYLWLRRLHTAPGVVITSPVAVGGA
jgi:hypothetical protein